MFVQNKLFTNYVQTGSGLKKPESQSPSPLPQNDNKDLKANDSKRNKALALSLGGLAVLGAVALLKGKSDKFTKAANKAQTNVESAAPLEKNNIIFEGIEFPFFDFEARKGKTYSKIIHPGNFRRRSENISSEVLRNAPKANIEALKGLKKETLEVIPDEAMKSFMSRNKQGNYIHAETIKCLDTLFTNEELASIFCSKDSSDYFIKEWTKIPLHDVYSATSYFKNFKTNIKGVSFKAS